MRPINLSAILGQDRLFGHYISKETMTQEMKEAGELLEKEFDFYQNNILRYMYNKLTNEQDFKKHNGKGAKWRKVWV